LVIATDTVAVGVTVISTVVLLGLVAAVVYLLRAVRQLRRQAEALARESRQLLGEIDATVRQAGHEVERMDRIVGSAEAISDAVGSASRLVGGAVSGPFIKVVAFGSGLVRGARALGVGSREGKARGNLGAAASARTRAPAKRRAGAKAAPANAVPVGRQGRERPRRAGAGTVRAS
jgi:hypothetical protein